MKYTVKHLGELADHFKGRIIREDEVVGNPRSLKREVEEAKGARRAFVEVVETLEATTIEP